MREQSTKPAKETMTGPYCDDDQETPMNRKTFFSLLPACLLAAALAGCADDGTDPGQGKVQIAITDAPGDFFSYTVDVTSVALRRADGAIVETLPTRTRIDFSEYVELAELLTIKTVPAGTYTGLRLTLDYAGSQIAAENDAGEPVAVTAVDETGQPLGTLALAVDFGERDRFTVRAGVPSHVTLDFDLAASHRLDSTAAPTSVTVLPVLFADAQLNDNRPHRLRGVVEQVDTANSRFQVDLRPFDRRSGDYGDVVVHATGTTHYEINRQSFIGAPGLAALASLALPVPAIVVGQVDRDARTLTATHVFAGTGERNANDDYIRGHVLARSGDRLTVMGLLVDRDEDQATFSRTITVDLAPAATTVSKEGGGAVTTADISVGQKVDVVGDHDTGTGDTAHVNARHVRLRYTDLSATVVSVSPFTLDLQAIGRIPAGRFDFAGTGAPGDDANPDSYEVDEGTLALVGVTPAEPVRVRGFVTAFGSAPPDFTAQTVINASQVPAALGVSWQLPGSNVAFPTLNESLIVVDLDDPQLDALHHVRRGGVVTDLTTLGGDLSLIPAERGRYALVTGEGIMAFGTFADFTAAVGLRMAEGGKARLLGAGGRLDDATVTFTAPYAAVVVLPP